MERLRAAGYARVSTARDCQDGSFESQRAYLEKILAEQPGLLPVGIYGDQGKSGRFMKNRPGLQRLIRDAEAGLVQIVYCKSISRLARNMRECLETLQRLQARKVDFVFIKEGIDTRVMQGELLLSIMAAISAAESDSISENVRLARRKSLLEGRVWHRPPYGYCWDESRNWRVVEDEALRIRRLFALAAAGHDYTYIRQSLNDLEAAGGTGRTWPQDKLLRAIRNEAYIGDYLSHKQLLLRNGDGSRKRLRNDGRQEQFYLENHHPAIIGRELFQRVNELQRHRLLDTRRSSVSISGGLTS